LPTAAQAGVCECHVDNEAPMREAGPLEREMGMAYYVSDADGTGGRMRDSPADFRVTELERFGAEVRPPDADPGSYPHLVFRATLRGWDTNDFADALSGKLGVSRERVSWAGTKDKRAVSSQLFSVRLPETGWPGSPDLPAVRDADVEVLGRAGRPLLFGDLAGNGFEVVVREPDRPSSADRITRGLRAFAGGDPEDAEAPTGVPNYFGHQRFGSRRAITHRVGLEIVRGNWEDAVLEYVATTAEAEPADTRAAREWVGETRDWDGAVERLPGKLRYERSMVHRLAENGGERPEHFRAALETVPTNLQRLLVNAAQSYVFNRVLSRRLERGLPFHEAVEGDVVCFADRDAPDGLVLPDTDRLQTADEGRLGTVNRHCRRGRAFVTAPLVGTDTEFAEGAPGELTREVLAELGLARGDFDLPGEFGSTGTRRAALLHAGIEVDREPLTFSFSLPKGSYATVVLREYLKSDPAALT
jgi:tRNA pseudouridine13 synthase